MAFDLKGKVALITGGASGIGLSCAKELLRNGVKGVTLADVNPKFGETALEEIVKEFGPNKAIFVNTDVTNIQQFEDAFKKTVETFKNVDILINNAGIFNDGEWEREIDVNFKGAIRGILLGLENYLQKYRQGEEAVIVNMSSIAAVVISSCAPVYGAIKLAILSLARDWGCPEHYERTKVRVFAVCPGATNTPMLFDASGKTIGEPYEKIFQAVLDIIPTQNPEFVAQEVAKLIKYCLSGTAWIVEEEKPAYQYIMAEKDTMTKS